jgi:predicted adenine nucleotide alpha hydrolase (AANH) superfamily ATPase
MIFAWQIFVVMLLIIPISSGCVTCKTPYLDKAVHFFLFAVLAYFFTHYLLFETKMLRKFSIFFVILLIIFQVFAFEYVQRFIPTRYPDIFDAIAGVVGGVAGVLVCLRRIAPRPKILLHICCAGCGIYVAKYLSQKYHVVLFYYNPNIYPDSEFSIRLNEAKRIAKILGLKIFSINAKHEEWLKKVSGKENCPEKGERCLICYEDRLRKTTETAKKNGISFFTSTLSVSPHKVAKEILRIGKELELEYGVNFVAQDFKKNDGFKKSVNLSKKYQIKRQDYCGCEFSFLALQEKKKIVK